MGLIRFILAFAVVICHVGFDAPPMMAIPGLGMGFRIIPADLAVQCFFVISGFYMSLILGKTYTLDRPGLSRFYVNRLLRLAPTYWVILGLFFVLAAMSGRFYRFEWDQLFTILERLPLSTSLWLVFTNVTMFAQDTLLFMGLTDTGHFQWTGDASAGPIPLYYFILNPPSWSLSLELWFYLLAPWFAGRHWKILVGAVAASAAIRVGLMVNGFAEGAWGDRFFPSELALFVTGMLLERMYSAYGSIFRFRRNSIVFGGVLVSMMAYYFIPLDQAVVHWGFLFFFVASVPFIFALTKDNKWDRAIGELSFPLYLSHILVQQFVFTYMKLLPQDSSWVIAAISLVLAIVLHYGLEAPVERLRRRFAGTSRGPNAATFKGPSLDTRKQGPAA